MWFLTLMDATGAALQALTSYGILDIMFGLGIVALIQRRLKKPATDEIDGVEIMPSLDIQTGLFAIRMKNASRDPLYLYRPSFRPGYRPTPAGPRFMRPFRACHWVNDLFPRVTEDTRTTRGDFIMQGLDPKGSEVDTVFLEPKESCTFLLGLEPMESENQRDWEFLLEARMCGEFRINFAHGSSAGSLQVQV